MLDRNITDEIEKRIQEVRNEGRELTIAEKDREYLYLNLAEIIKTSLFEVLSVPNLTLTGG
jgi:hypothetical protein